MKFREFTIGINMPEGLKKLESLTYNLWWTYSNSAQELFKMISPEKWESLGHDPLTLLMDLTNDKLLELENDHVFMSVLNDVWDEYIDYIKFPKWFEIKHPKLIEENFKVAYFSAEYGLHESIHLFSGGLGILSGDHCKSASDLGIPFIAVGLLYRNGYFHQYLNTDGWQQEYSPYNEFYKMPVSVCKDDEGKDVLISVESPGGEIWVKLWEMHLGLIRIIFLDTDLGKNKQEDRNITGQLYGGDTDMRIRQEIILGIGGIRALKALNIAPTVYHVNEGHPALLILERIKNFMSDDNLDFITACEVVKKSTLFTTHTPVAAGFDVFNYGQMKHFISPIFSKQELDMDTIMKIGRMVSNNSSETFSMAISGIKLSNFRNGVSKLHGKVSRDMFKMLWPKAVGEFVPIDYVTNGVHLTTWVSDEFKNIFNRYMGDSWHLKQYDLTVWKLIETIPDLVLFRAKNRTRARLIEFTRNRLKKQISSKGGASSELISLQNMLDPDHLTIGFARRFATYKRAYLLFMDEERLSKILNNEEMPIQIIIAGKAHPKDDAGKDIIKKIFHISRKKEFRKKIAFIEDYDFEVGKFLVQGVDMWLNTPRRPMEASGTSGIKAAANGALNFSVLDGWWDEAYNGHNGWSIGSGEVYEDIPYQDYIESQEIYDKLEHEIAPLFYQRDKSGLPGQWIGIIKNSLKTIPSFFNTSRMVIEYTNKFYLNLHKTFLEMKGDNYDNAKRFVEWKEDIRSLWDKLKFISTTLHAVDMKAGNLAELYAKVELNDINPEDIAVYSIVQYNAKKLFEEPHFYKLKPVSNEKGFAEYKGEIVLEKAGKLNVAFAAFPYHPYIPNLFENNIITWA